MDVVIPIERGGTGSKDPVKAIQNIGGIHVSSINVPNGVAGSNIDNLISRGKVNATALRGPTSVMESETVSYTITNFDSYESYNISSPDGNVSLLNNIITFTAGPLAGTNKLIVNGRELTIQVNQSLSTVHTPEISSPLSNAVTDYTVNIVASSFSNIVSDVHQSSTWQLATDSNFSNIVLQSVNDTVNLTTWSVSNLLPGTDYYIRVRYKGTGTGSSAWGSIRFITKASIDVPAIVNPGNNTGIDTTTVTFTSSDFHVIGGIDTHLSTSWQLSTDASFSNIFNHEEDSFTDKTSWTVTGLILNTVYYVRVRYKGTNLGYGSWSNYSKITTGLVITPPELRTPEYSIIGNFAVVNLITRQFNTTGGSDVHLSTSWQIATDSNFTNISVQFTDDPSNLLTFPVTTLTKDVVYYVRVRYKGSSQQYSDWSQTIRFITDSTYHN